jgi:hypothetical protein
MLITFITAVLLAIFNFAANRSNEQIRARLNEAAATTLAELQAKLAVETARSVESIRAEFARSVNESTERLRLELNRSAEDFKARLGQTIPQRYNGYHSMFKAATKYFFALRILEKGIYPDAELQAAGIAADDAIASALTVDQEDRMRFFSFVREALVLAEKARENQDIVHLKDLWEDEGKTFGGRYNDLEAKFSAKVRL